MRSNAATNQNKDYNYSVNSFLNSNSLKFLGLFIFSIFINYYTPLFVRETVFISYLILFYNSKNDAFWIAFFWILNYAPAYLFNSSDPLYNLNFISVPGFQREFFYLEFAIITALLKAFIKKSNVKLKTPGNLKLLIIYSLFLFLITFFYDTEIFKILRTIRFLIPFTLFYSLPKLIATRERFLEVFNYFIFFSIVIFVFQLYVFLTGNHFFTFVGGSFAKNLFIKENYDVEVDLIRPNYSTHILILNIIIGIYYLLKKEKEKENIPKAVPFFIALSWLSLALSGTRGYLIAASVMVILFVFSQVGDFIKNIKYVSFFFVAIILLLTINPIQEQFTMAMDRVSTIFLLAGGDETAGGTLRRITQYMPMIEEKIPQSPMFGFGYSSTFFNFTNGHIGNHNIILNGGYFGFLLFILFILYFIFKPLLIFKKTGKNSFIALSIGVLGFFIIHSTSFAVFSFLIGQTNCFAFILLVSFIIVSINTSGNNKNLKKSRFSHSGF